jgi:3-mercaptopyruvate sulfurtransferase SseA
VARTLAENGFSQAKALVGGFAAWEAAGYPLEPKKTASENRQAKKAKRKS